MRDRAVEYDVAAFLRAFLCCTLAGASMYE